MTHTTYPTYEEARAAARIKTRQDPRNHHGPEQCPDGNGWYVLTYPRKQYHVIRYDCRTQEAVLMAQGDYEDALGYALHHAGPTGPVLFETHHIPGARVHGFDPARVFYGPYWDGVHYVVDAGTFPVQVEVFSMFEMLDLHGQDRHDPLFRNIEGGPA